MEILGKNPWEPCKKHQDIMEIIGKNHPQQKNIRGFDPKYRPIEALNVQNPSKLENSRGAKKSKLQKYIYRKM